MTVAEDDVSSPPNGKLFRARNLESHKVQVVLEGKRMAFLCGNLANA